ncbi:UNVERIFIED_CONTAM: hypothetical protein IGO34_28845, partial [Salmonella enterica subsp. enterica serovar Weltevreden]
VGSGLGFGVGFRPGGHEIGLCLGAHRLQLFFQSGVLGPGSLQLGLRLGRLPGQQLNLPLSFALLFGHALLQLLLAQAVALQLFLHLVQLIQ